MWTEKDNFDLLENINVKSKFKDGVFQFYQIYPVDGFVLRIPNGDMYQTDIETGDFVLDENGNKILEMPYRTKGGATELAGYDWVANPKNYYAEKYTEDMTVF